MIKLIKIAVVSSLILGLLLVGIYFLLIPPDIDPKEYPKHLSDKKQTIELRYVGWACDCAEWATTTDIDLYHDNMNDTLVQLSIFLEAADDAEQIADEYKNACCGNRIQFVGNFYEDKGISKDYELKTPEKPSPARVFKYTSYQLIKPYTFWDFDAPKKSKVRTKIIQ